jgi:hypothetical protein
LIGENVIDFGVQRHVGDDFVFSLNAFPYRLAGLNLIPFDLEASREGAVREIPLRAVCDWWDRS